MKKEKLGNNLQQISNESVKFMDLKCKVENGRKDKDIKRRSEMIHTIEQGIRKAFEKRCKFLYYKCKDTVVDNLHMRKTSPQLISTCFETKFSDTISPQERSTDSNEPKQGSAGKNTKLCGMKIISPKPNTSSSQTGEPGPSEAMRNAVSFLTWSMSNKTTSRAPIMSTCSSRESTGEPSCGRVIVLPKSSQTPTPSSEVFSVKKTPQEDNTVRPKRPRSSAESMNPSGPDEKSPTSSDNNLKRARLSTEMQKEIPSQGSSYTTRWQHSCTSHDQYGIYQNSQPECHHHRQILASLQEETVKENANECPQTLETSSPSTSAGQEFTKRDGGQRGII